MNSRLKYLRTHIMLVAVLMAGALFAHIPLVTGAHADGTKKDIRGLTIGMTKNQVYARYAKCVLSDNKFSNMSMDIPLDGAPPEYNQTSMVCGPFTDGTKLVVYFTPEISGGRVYAIEYYFSDNGRSLRELIAYVAQEYGLNSNWPAGRANCWQANSVTMDWQLDDSVCLGFDSGRYALLTMAQFSLKKNGRANALRLWQSKVRSNPLPKF